MIEFTYFYFFSTVIKCEQNEWKMVVAQVSWQFPFEYLFIQFAQANSMLKYDYCNSYTIIIII